MGFRLVLLSKGCALLFHLHLEVCIEAESVGNMARVDEGRFCPERPRVVVGIWARSTVIRVVGLHVVGWAGDAISCRPESHVGRCDLKPETGRIL